MYAGPKGESLGFGRLPLNRKSLQMMVFAVLATLGCGSHVSSKPGGAGEKERGTSKTYPVTLGHGFRLQRI